MSAHGNPGWQDWMGVWGSDEVPLAGRYTVTLTLSVMHPDGTWEVHNREIPLLEVKGGTLHIAVRTTLNKDEEAPPA